MAIKRPSKSRGTPIRAPVSPGVRHVEVKLPHQMVSGEAYLGWLCKNKSCGLVIAMVPTQSAGKPASADSDDRPTVIKCPHCGDEDLYRWSARTEHQYTARSAAT